MHPPKRLRPVLRVLSALALTLVLGVLLVAAPPAQAADPIPPGSLKPATLGELIFNDRSLSAGGNLACASCHVRSRGHADAAGVFMPMGGAAPDQQGHRSSMALSYQAFNPPFSLDPTGLPRGGYFWDGRANTLANQALGPLFNPREMALTSLAEFLDKLRAAPYWNEMVRLYPLGVRSAARTHFLAAFGSALTAYQQGDADFALFNSKFDRVQDGQASFTAAELRGLQVFNSPQRGNCASCHTSASGPNGARPLFTDNRYHALGLPRNMAIGVNSDPNYYDMGVCGPDRSDLGFRGNVVQTPPFGLPAGAPPRLNPQNVNDLVAFLLTLTDDTSAPRQGAQVQGKSR